MEAGGLVVTHQPLPGATGHSKKAFNLLEEWEQGGSDGQGNYSFLKGKRKAGAAHENNAWRK